MDINYSMKYVFLWKEADPILLAEANILPYSNPAALIGKHDIEVLYFAENCTVTAYMNEKDFEKAKDVGKTLLAEDKSRSIVKESKKARKKFDDFISKIKHSYSDISDKHLLKEFTEFYSRLKKLFEYFVIFRPEVLQQMELVLKKKLDEKIKNEESRKNYFTILTTPSELNAIDKEEIEFIKLRHSLENTGETEKIQKLKAHALKYYGFFLNTFSIDNAVKSLEDKIVYEEKAKKPIFEKRMKEVSQKKQNLKRKQQKILSEMNDKEAERIAMFFQQSALERLEIKMRWAGAEFIALPILNEIIKRMNITKEDFFKAVRAEDIEKFFKNNQRLSDEKIQQRKRVFMFLAKNEQLQFFSAEDAEKWKENNLKKETEKIIEIKGSIANLGKAVGKAKIINVQNLETLIKDLEKMNYGDILITQMTQPNMVIACKKASAIVTDEGGITSHAAIISREFGIPCIVGTKNATTLIKDGEKIEVDANKGTVRKI